MQPRIPRDRVLISSSPVDLAAREPFEFIAEKPKVCGKDDLPSDIADRRRLWSECHEEFRVDRANGKSAMLE